MKPLHARFTDEQLAVLQKAIGAMNRERTLVTEPNPDLDACALYYICRRYVETTVTGNTGVVPAS